MTIHHDIALALAVLLVLACIAFGQHCGEHVRDIIAFASTIAVATFAHAQGVKTGAAAAQVARRQEPPPDGGSDSNPGHERKTR